MATGSAVETQDMVQPRVIIEVDRGASAIIIEHHLSEGPHAFLSNSVTSIALQESSRLEHFRVFSGSASATHTDLLQLHAAAHSHLRQHTVALSGGFVRTGLTANLDATGAMLDSYSLLTGHDSRHTDCVNIVRHAAPHTQSRQTARIIASGRSRAIFNSKVVVDKGAQKADSQQSCRGLLLSPTAEIDSRPQLEINADDVKCAHGATTGRLDPDMLFYMLSRGLDRNAAQSLLVFAFLADALTDMSLPTVRTAVESQLIAQLPDSQLLRQFR
jgi:Fe-S cluster assembly protein SufD